VKGRDKEGLRMEERKWRKRREWEKRSGEARWGKKWCSECYRGDGGVEN